MPQPESVNGPRRRSVFARPTGAPNANAAETREARERAEAIAIELANVAADLRLATISAKTQADRARVHARIRLQRIQALAHGEEPRARDKIAALCAEWLTDIEREATT